MHRGGAALVAAQRDDDIAPVGIAALRKVVRPVNVQTRLFQQTFGADQRIERAEYPLQVSRIVYEAVDAFALARDERTGRQAEAQGRQHLVDARFVLAGSGCG